MFRLASALLVLAALPPVAALAGPEQPAGSEAALEPVAGDEAAPPPAAASEPTEPAAPPRVESPAVLYDLAALYEQARPAVVRIRVAKGAGSGFLIGDGTVVLTAFHVVRDSTDIVVESIAGAESTATLVGWDRKEDVAVLRLPAPLPETAVLELRAAADLPEVGDPVAVLGHPLLYDDEPEIKTHKGLLGWSLTAGIVSKVGERRLQTTAIAHSGNSGGPMLDAQGRVIGVLIERLGDFSVATQLGRVEELLAQEEPMKPPPAIEFALKIGPRLELAPFLAPERRIWMGFELGLELTIERRLRFGVDLRYAGLVSKTEREAGRKASRWDVLGRIGPVFDLGKRHKLLGRAALHPYFVGGVSVHGEGTDFSTMRLLDPSCDPATDDCPVELESGTDWTRTPTPYLGGGLQFDLGRMYIGVEAGGNPLAPRPDFRVQGVLGWRF